MKIKLFITDIDGVWTDGGMYYDNQGNEMKKFNTKDSAGVLFLKQLNIPVAIITGEKNQIIGNRAHKLNIEYIYEGVKNKLLIAQQLCNELKITLQQVAFIGDSIGDILLLEKAGLSAAPADAPQYIKKLVKWNLKMKGGEGVFFEFVEKYLLENNLLEKCIDNYLIDIQKNYI